MRREALLTVQEGGVAACHGGVAKCHRWRAVTDDLLSVATGSSPVTRAGVNPNTITAGGMRSDPPAVPGGNRERWRSAPGQSSQPCRVRVMKSLADDAGIAGRRVKPRCETPAPISFGHAKSDSSSSKPFHV